MRIRRDKNFVSFFDEATGRYIRTGILIDGKDTGEDPFMSSFPELLDVGIMGHCHHGKAGLCQAAGVECYQNGPNSDAPDMSLDDFREIAHQCAGKTYQFALGGCGDPDQHPDFEGILKICREACIVPNYTTSGLGMSQDIASLSKQYCGAVAVSWYRSPYTLTAIDLLLQAGVKTNIHFVLSRKTLPEAVDILAGNQPLPLGINAVVFLLHKPVGLGTRENVIELGNKHLQDFLSLVDRRQPFKTGFDSCSTPALVIQTGTLDLDSLDTCEGARWSAYITADMKMLPCSFDQGHKWAVDLRSKTILEAWNSPEFDDFRNRLRNACPGCDKQSLCMGGCPICPEIVLCNRRSSSRYYGQ